MKPRMRLMTAGLWGINLPEPYSHLGTIFGITPEDTYRNYQRICSDFGLIKQEGKCWCRTCRPITLEDMRFVVCPECGNKRCPKANDHRNECTNSNDPGQPGSAYPNADTTAADKAA